MLIHPDFNARKRDYQDLEVNQVRLTKIFPTLQGEGPLAGQWAVFVRLAGCNLGSKSMCPWCDTEFHFKKGRVSRVADVLTIAEDYYRQYAGLRERIMVLTGGEPLLQNPHVLIDYFINNHWLVQVETNGYFWSEELNLLKLIHGHRFLVIVSPKANARAEFPALDERLFHIADALKVVVDDDGASAYCSPPDYVFEFQETGRPVYVTPVNHYRALPHPNNHAVGFWNDRTPLDRERCGRNHRYAARMAMTYGWRLSLQTHLFAELE